MLSFPHMRKYSLRDPQHAKQISLELLAQVVNFRSSTTARYPRLHC